MNDKPKNALFEKKHLWVRFAFLPFFILIIKFLFDIYRYPQPKKLMGDEGSYFNFARQIAAGESPEHHPFWPPLYGESLGQLFQWVDLDLSKVIWIQLALWGLGCFLFSRIVLHVTKNSLLAGMAGFAWLMAPDMASFFTYLWPEIPHLFFMVLAWWCWVRGQGRVWTAIPVGLALALALLSKLLLQPFLPLCFLVVLLLAKENRKQVALRVALVFTTILIVLMPILWCNYQKHGQWMVADSALFNVWVGLNDTSNADYVDDIAGIEFQAWEVSGETWLERKQVYREKLKQKLADEGLVTVMLGQFPKQYRRLLDPHNFLVTQLPGEARSTYAGKFTYQHSFLKRWSYVWHALLLSLTAFGVCLIRWRTPSWWWLPGGFLLYNLALFSLVHVKTRFLIQMVPAMIPFMVLGGCSLVWMLGWAKKDGVPWLPPMPVQVVHTPVRMLLGALLAMGLLLLAFYPR